MAISSGGTLGTGTHSTSASSFTLTTATNALAAGDFAMLEVVTDNLQTTTGPSTNHTGVSGTNLSATKLGEYTNGQSAAAAGVTTSLWLLEATGAVGTGAVITVSLSGAVVDKVAGAWKFTKGAGMAIRLCNVPGQFAANPIMQAVNASNGFGSAAFSGGPSQSRLYFRAMGKEANSTTALTVSSGFTATTAQRSRNNAAAVLVRGEFRINTSTGETSNPTMAVSGDTAAVFAALEEYDPRPTITSQPANQSALDGGSATFSFTAADASSYKWQEQMPGEGGGAAYIEGSAQPLIGGDNSITIPAGAQSAVLLGTWWHGGGSTPGWACTALPDLNTNRVFNNGNSAPPYPSGMLRTYSGVTATGAQTLTLSGQTDIFNGPGGFILFYDGPIEIIDGDANSVGDTGSAGITLDSEVGAAIVVLDSNLDTTTPPSTPVGWTELETVGNNSLSATLRMKVSAGSSEGITSTSPNYETLIAFAIRGGSGPTWEDVVGETTDDLVFTGLTLADNGRVFRGVATNAFGDTYTNEITLTVTDGKLISGNVSTGGPAVSLATVDVPAPSGMLPGHRDLLLVGLGAVAPAAAPNITHLDGVPVGSLSDWEFLGQSGPLVIGGGAFNLRLAAFTRVSDGAGSTLEVEADGAGYWGYDRIWFDNANADFVGQAVLFDDLTTTTTPVLPGITPTKTNAYMLQWHVLGALVGITPPMGTTELAENATNGLGLYGEQLDDLTPTGTRTYSYSGGGADAGYAVLELHSLVSEGGGSEVSAVTSLSVAVERMRSASASVALAVRAPGQRSVAMAAAVRFSDDAQSDLALAVRQARAASGLVDGTVRSLQSRGVALDLSVERVRSAAAALDMAIRRAEGAALGLDMPVQAAGHVSASLALMVQAGQSVSAELRLAVRAVRSAVADLSLAVAIDRVADVAVDGAVQAGRSAASAIDLAVCHGRSAATGVDLQVQDGYSALLAVQSAVQFAVDASVVVDVAVSRLASAAVSLGAAVSMSRVLGQQIDVAVCHVRASGIGVSVFVASDLMRWDAAGWVEAGRRRWNGVGWVDSEQRRWNGASWI